MRNLLSVRENIFYSDKEGKKKQHEIILLIDEAEYKYSNEGAIIRERGISEVRFVVENKNFQKLINALQEFCDATESDLKDEE